MVQKGIKHVNNAGGGGGAVYGLGLIGALFYFIQNAQGFEQIVWGIIKSILWPAFFVYASLNFLSL